VGAALRQQPDNAMISVGFIGGATTSEPRIAIFASALLPDMAPKAKYCHVRFDAAIGDFLAEIFDQEASLAAFNRFESQQRVRRVDSAMSELSPFTPQ
jgi:hypothetical protein